MGCSITKSHPQEESNNAFQTPERQKIRSEYAKLRKDYLVDSFDCPDPITNLNTNVIEFIKKDKGALTYLFFPETKVSIETLDFIFSERNKRLASNSKLAAKDSKRFLLFDFYWTNETKIHCTKLIKKSCPNKGFSLSANVDYEFALLYFDIKVFSPRIDMIDDYIKYLEQNPENGFKNKIIL